MTRIIARHQILAQPLIEEQEALHAAEARDRRQMLGALALVCGGIVLGVLGVFCVAALS